MDLDAFKSSREENTKFVTIGIIYVDDLLIASNSTKSMQQVITQVKENLRVKDLGPMEHFLGIKVTQNKGTDTHTHTHSQKKLVEVNPVEI